MFHMLVCAAGRDASSSSPSSLPSQSTAAAQLACHVITAPQLLRQLPASARKQVTQLPVLNMVMTALHCLASHSHETKDATSLTGDTQAGVKSVDKNQRAVFGMGLRGNGSSFFRVQLESREAALVALGNLAGMLSGERVSKPTQVCLSLTK